MNNLNPAVTAAAINGADRQNLQKIVGAIDPDVVAYAVNNNGDFVEDLIPWLDAKKLAAPMNSANGRNFTERLLRGGLKASTVAAILNGNTDFVSQLVSALEAAEPKYAIQAIANGINFNTDFLSDLLTYTHASGIADVLNYNGNAQQFVIKLVGLLDGQKVAQSLSEHPDVTIALLASPPGGIDPEVLNSLLSRLEPSERTTFTNLVAGVLAKLDAADTRTMLTESGNFIGHLLNMNAGGLQPEVIIDAINGPNNAGTNPTTGTAWDPSQNVLRKTYMDIVVEMNILGLVLNPPFTIQFQGARMNSAPGEPVLDQDHPW
jgi:hypothetical protein